MALRNVLKVENDNESLRIKCRDIKVIDDKIRTLAADMLETMYAQNGVGLAAPQVGVLKKLIVIDIGEGPVTLINPIIVYQKGEQEEIEGCLSVPGVWGTVKRPQRVIARGENLDGEVIEVEGEGLMAIALCHEIDHLSGTLYTDKVIRYIDPSEMEDRRK